MSDDRQYAPATLRNRDFILDVLRDVLPMTGVILEIASGSGEHIVHFAKNFPALVFQPSLRRRRSISTVRTYARGFQQPRATKRSTGAFAIATVTGSATATPALKMKTARGAEN